MPYNRNSQLPGNIRSAIASERGKTMFRRVVNNQLEAGKPESVAFASAWSALKNAGYEKNDKGVWIKKAHGAVPLYMYRPVLNAEKVHEWAKSQGMDSVIQPDDMHVTVVYSRDPFSREYSQMAEEDSPQIVHYGNIPVRGGKRSCVRLGKNGEAVVLKLECPMLQEEHDMFRRMGASWDYDSYQPHITLSYNAEGLDVDKMEPFEDDIVLGDLVVEKLDENWQSSVIEKSSPSLSDVHVPSTGKKKPMEKEEMFTPPKSAQNNAKKVLRWKEEHGDEVNGMTSVGWRRARQLASGKPISRDIVARMSSFNRHRKNSKIDPEYENEPWKDAGYVAWLGWGGTSGVNWAMDKMDTLRKRRVNDDLFTTREEALSRSYGMPGLEDTVHVHEVDGQAYYMPGASHEDYIEYYSEDTEDNEEEHSEERGLMEEAIRAILEIVMEKDSMPDRVSMSASILKNDPERKIVWGWASVSTVDGELLYDSHGDSISPDEMSKMADDFMADVRTAKVMHTGRKTGEVIHSLPITKELADAFGIETNKEGWIIGMKVHDDEVWKKVKSGDLKAFSIGGYGDRHIA